VAHLWDEAKPWFLPCGYCGTMTQGAGWSTPSFLPNCWSCQNKLKNGRPTLGLPAGCATPYGVPKTPEAVGSTARQQEPGWARVRSTGDYFHDSSKSSFQRVGDRIAHEREYGRGSSRGDRCHAYCTRQNCNGNCFG
jgi:hypothetical protein